MELVPLAVASRYQSPRAPSRGGPLGAVFPVQTSDEEQQLARLFRTPVLIQLRVQSQPATSLSSQGLVLPLLPAPTASPHPSAG